MVFNPYALIDLTGFVVAILLLITLYKAIYEKELKNLILLTYLFASLIVLTEFLLESLSLEKYYDIIITLIELEILFGYLSTAFLSILIIKITNIEIKKIFNYIIFIPSIITLIILIFFPGQYIIINIKRIHTGYFGVYSNFLRILNYFYTPPLFTFITFALIQKLKKTKDIIQKKKVFYIIISIIIFLLWALIFNVLQFVFNIYYLSVGGINFYIIFLGFLSLIFINRNITKFNIILRNKILFPLFNIILVAFFLFLLFLLKNLWHTFIKDTSTITFTIFITFAIIYIFPIYNKFLSLINKLLYRTPIDLTESTHIFLSLIERTTEINLLREKLWKWFEDNQPIKTLIFYKVENNKIKLIKKYGENHNTTPQLKRLINIDGITEKNNKLYFLIKDKKSPVEIIEIIPFKNKRFNKYTEKILEIILLYYEIFYTNIKISQKLLNKGKMKLLKKLSKNLKSILKNIKFGLHTIQEELNYSKKNNQTEINILKEKIILKLNKIIEEMRII